MDSSFTVKPRDSVARTAAPGRRNIVRTDLSPSQSVSAAQQSAPSHQSAGEGLTRDPSLDPQCQMVLDREREERERRRARKDEALLRQKAYGRPEPATDQPGGSPHTDFEI